MDHNLGKHLLAPALGAVALCLSSSILHAQAYTQINLVSDIPGLAANFDPHLINPWGISENAASPFWVSDAGTGVSTLYNTAGVPQSLVVTIPAPGGGPSVPTGQVFNSSTSFNTDIFIFASARGTITGWRGALGTTAEILLDNSTAGASYLGLAIGSIGANTYLYAADFGNNQITVLPGTGAPALTGLFRDTLLPVGYAPFNVQNIGGSLYVTYALKGADGEDAPGAGHGFVDKYDLNGNLITRFASGGALNSPWGLALAPLSFGGFGGDLLVGNFGDGTINAYDPITGAWVGVLKDAAGDPIVNDGLWGLQFGNGGNGGTLGTLYFAAGINNEADGLFGAIVPVPEPSTTTAVAGVGLVGLCLVARLRRRQGKAAVAPTTAS